MTQHGQKMRPLSLHELKKLRKPIKDVNQDFQERLSVIERMALFISDHVGTPGFFFLILVWTLFWLGWNFAAPAALKFDRPMAFVFWLFISNMLQIFLMPLIMVAQNLQNRHTELRAQQDFEVNCKAEREIEAILQHLEEHHVMLHALLAQHGIEVPDSSVTPAHHEPTI